MDPQPAPDPTASRRASSYVARWLEKERSRRDPNWGANKKNNRVIRKARATGIGGEMTRPLHDIIGSWGDRNRLLSEIKPLATELHLAALSPDFRPIYVIAKYFQLSDAEIAIITDNE
jgi:hypothetical protein